MKRNSPFVEKHFAAAIIGSLNCLLSSIINKEATFDWAIAVGCSCLSVFLLLNIRNESYSWIFSYQCYRAVWFIIKKTRSRFKHSNVTMIQVCLCVHHSVQSTPLYRYFCVTIIQILQKNWNINRDVSGNDQNRGNHLFKIYWINEW